MRSFGLRDVLGPIMVGPSSSHTAGALRIAQMARQLLDAPPVEAEFTLYGSFARTYRGHGTDRALVAGMLGMHTDDPRIRDSLQIARERGLRFGIAVDPKTRVSQPNTVDVRVRDANGDEIVARGESVGGGAARLTMIDGHGVQITGEYNALILYERDVPGVLGHIASTLGAGGVNIGSVWMYRSRRGGEAFNVLEVDGPVPPDVRRAILASPDVLRMRFVPADGLSSPRGQEGLGAPSMDAGEAERALPEVDFEDAAGLLAYADERGLTLGQAFMRREEVCEAMHGRPLAAAERYLDDALRVMRDSVRGPLGGDVRTMGGLIGGESRALARLAGWGGALAGGVDARAALLAMAVLETNASMGRIVAAPTAGSSGVVPGVVLALDEAERYGDARLRDALACAAAVGFVVSRNATVAGAEGGCQAEVGTASAMAAAAATQLLGGGARACLDAASIAMGNLMGMVCDPVGGLVEDPCQKRNAAAAENALASARMALAGVRPSAPFDEVVEAMRRVGAALPAELRETALGGLAACPSCRGCAGR